VYRFSTIVLPLQTIEAFQRFPCLSETELRDESDRIANVINRHFMAEGLSNAIGKRLA
jgi:hypothetical protein